MVKIEMNPGNSETLDMNNSDKGNERSIEQSEASPVIMKTVSDISEQLIKEGEEAFFKELPMEEDSILNMNSENLRKELTADIKDFASKVENSMDLTYEYIKLNRGDLKSWTKSLKETKTDISRKRAKLSGDERHNESLCVTKKSVTLDYLPDNCIIPTNSEEMRVVSRLVTAMKMWINLKVPRIEDGNNYGVSVQEEFIDVLSGIEKSVSYVIASTAKYHNDRGQAIIAIIKFPEIVDFQQALLSLDEMTIHDIKYYLFETRNALALTFDAILKNINWLYTPRMQTDVQHMFI